MTLMNVFLKEKLGKVETDTKYKTSLLNRSGDLINGRCYYILGNVNVYIQAMETSARIVKWSEIFYV